MTMAGDVNKQSEPKLSFLADDRLSISQFDRTTRKFTTSKTVNILNDPQLMNISDQHQWQRYELLRQHEQSLSKKLISPVFVPSAPSSATSIEQQGDDNIEEELRSLTEHRLPDLCNLDGEPMQFTRGLSTVVTRYAIDV